jgi:invasion protein IalB
MRSALTPDPNFRDHLWISQAQLDASVLVALQQGIDAQVNMLGVNGEEVSLPISLLGFTGAWNRLAEM